MVARVLRGTEPLGICNHCGTVSRVWDYGEPAVGKEHAICYQCIKAIISAFTR